MAFGTGPYCLRYHAASIAVSICWLLLLLLPSWLLLPLASA